MIQIKFTDSNYETCIFCFVISNTDWREIAKHRTKRAFESVSTIKVLLVCEKLYSDRLRTNDFGFAPCEASDQPVYPLILFGHFANIPMQYTGIFHGCKNDNFQLILFDFFHSFAQNIDCGYTLEPPQ